MNADVIYFFTDEFISSNETRMKPCGCGEPSCNLLVFDNLNELPENRDLGVIYVDFFNKKRI